MWVWGYLRYRKALLWVWCCRGEERRQAHTESPSNTLGSATALSNLTRTHTSTRSTSAHTLKSAIRDNKQNSLTGHEQAQAVAVVVRKVVSEQQGPVSCEEVKGREEVSLGVTATGTQSSVDQLYQSATLREHWLGLTQPRTQVKLHR